MMVQVRNHPIHAMLVHFPSALFPTSLLFDVVGMICGKPILFHSSFYCQLTGVIVGGFAAVLGMVDLYGLSKADDKKWINNGLLHGGINFFVLTIYFGLVVYRVKEQSSVTWWLVVIEGFAIIFLIVGNYFGVEIYQRILRQKIR